MTEEMENDWMVLGRRGFEHDSSTTLNTAEAIERLTLAIIEAHKVLDRDLQDPPEVRTRQVIFGGPWVVEVHPPFKPAYNEAGGGVVDDPVWEQCDTLEAALENTFRKVQSYIRTAVEQHATKADALEAMLATTRDRARKLDLIQQAMGAFWPKQALLPFPDPESDGEKITEHDLFPEPYDPHDSPSSTGGEDGENGEDEDIPF